MSTDVCVEFPNSHTVNVITSTEGDKKKPSFSTFSFDRVFDSNSTQVQVYEYSAKSIVDSVLEGFNGTIFAYGQTSSGKTFTMQGVLEDPELEGITPRLARYLFEQITKLSSEKVEYVIKASIIEIYNEKIKDLIDVTKVNLQVREDKVKGIYIESLSEYIVDSAGKVLNLIKKGMNNRSVNATNMNEQSSRSHCIVVLNIIQNNLKDLSAKAGKLYLVDLAGSEKISKTGATGVVLDEAKMINKSLTNLGHVINSLTDGKNSHVPYRDSKLTRVLQESLGGNSRTCLIITCSPSAFNEQETLSTLRFGLRAKKVKNQAKVNKEHSIQELKQKVNNLEGQLGDFKSRVGMLEEILLKNGLALPGQEEYDLVVDRIESEVQLNSSTLEIDVNAKEEAVNLFNAENTTTNHYNYSTPEKNVTISNQLNLSMLNENNILEINQKYIDVINIVNDLETEKSDLEDKLKSASERLKEVNLEKEVKDSMVKELEEMRTNSDKKAADVEEKIRIMKKYMEKNKQNLSLISEVDLDFTMVNDSGFKMFPNSNLNSVNPQPHRRLSSKLSIDLANISSVKRKSFNDLEMEYRPEICLEILKKEESVVSVSINSFKCLSNRSRGEEGDTGNMHLLTTNPFSIGKDIEMNTNSEDLLLLNSKLHNNTPEYIGNVSSLIQFNTGINNNQIFEDFMDKLKNYSDKVPEINNLIETYKEKLQINENKIPRSTNCSNSDEEEALGKLNKDKLGIQRRMTEMPKNNVLLDIENKVEKVKFISFNLNIS